MYVFHICPDYAGSRIYPELLGALSTRKFSKQTVYVPTFTERPSGRHFAEVKFPNLPEVFYSRDFCWYDRLFFRRKYAKITKAIRCRFAINSISVIHAHTLFSAGSVAKELLKYSNARLVAAVRNTDLNYFFRYALHLRSTGLEIMLAANKLVFLSPSYRDTLLHEYVPVRLRENLRSKCVVLPNGIEQFWLTNSYVRQVRVSGTTIHLLFVGELTKNKNAKTCIRAVKVLRDLGYDPILKIVGDGPEANALKAQAKGEEDHIQFCGWLNSKEDLLREYRAADVLVLPSFKETFGLVYIEALSQGLPLIWTKDQGIHGYFDEGSVGYSCEPHDPFSIADKIISVINNYAQMSRLATESAAGFSWAQVAHLYHELYLTALLRG